MGTSNSSQTQPKEYPRLIHIERRIQDNSGRKLTKMGFLINPPISQYNITAMIHKSPLLISGCILPGQDISNSPNTKKCQDNYSFMIFQNTIFAMLFDGHGLNGHLVAEFCVDFYSQYFYKHFKDFLYDTKNTLKDLFFECDEALKSRNEINCELSGATSIAMFITTSHLHIASVGDSRAILGCESGFTYQVAQLTTDQKPNHAEEYKRIKASGGTVRRFIDEKGNKKGPYRIWQGDSNIPGLAMSRCIGDFIAKSIGVIPAPIYSNLELHAKDKFVIAASDGIWDVMTNQEVIDFVAENLDKCNSEPTAEYPANCKNSTIARILCEEARSRWILCEKIERSTYDDISCIIIRMNNGAKTRERVVRFNCTMYDGEYQNNSFE